MSGTATAADLALDGPVSSVPGVSGRFAAQLREAFDIRTVHDLLDHPPRRYDDAGAVLDLSEATVGEPVTLIGTIVDWEVRRAQKGRGRPLDIATATVVQASGSRFQVTFFNQRFRPRQLPTGTVAAFSSTLDRFRSMLKLSSPEVHVLGRVRHGVAAGDPLGPGDLDRPRLLPIYPAVQGVPSFRMLRAIESALDHLSVVPEWLPTSWLDELDLLARDDAVRGLHLPPDHETAQAARRRLTFDELFALQLGLQSRRARLEAATVGQDNGPLPQGKAASFLEALPFPPTGAQRRAFEELATDLASSRPMHRLLQGDVGSGKTIVAVWSLLAAIDRGRQAALMAPTEVLAEQHHRTLTELLAPLGVNVLDGVRVELLTGSSTASHRRRVLGELLSGDVDLVVGTHALLEEGVRFADLGVVVIDEQHRFGVSQRVQLKDKAAGEADREVLPDVLVMTATPIPRSLALTVYGDLDVTVLDELPPGREPIRTALITPEEDHRRAALYDFVRREAAEGRQAFVVCPLVEQGEVEATNVTDHHRHLAETVFPELTVELVHGRMRPDAKEAAMRRFRTGEAQILVSTTVIEVGVDVPQATVMIIEDAERFGISQLHQLRGRVGRGGGASYCVLFAGWHGELTRDATKRLEAVAATTDGFALAEADLDIRGTGQLFGTSQSGGADLRLAHLQRDQQLIQLARDRAREVVATDPDLQDPCHARLRAEVERRFDGGLAAFDALATG